MVGDSPVVKSVRESPNGRARHDGEQVLAVVIHGTWMRGDEEALARLCDPATEVSCHYYITRKGEVIQLVREGRVAHHAGASKWVLDGQLREGLNGWSIGIEVGNAGPFAVTPTAGAEASPVDWSQAEPYLDVQYEALIELLRDILKRRPEINVNAVLGHSDVSPGRKSDPGLHFDWQRLVNAGVCARKPSI